MNVEPSELRACCASPRWRELVLADAPFTDTDALVAASDRALEQVSWPEIEKAVAAHPRIGERAAGTSQEARWSRAEQSAAGTDDDDLKQALVEGNRAYEQRFGHVFLVYANGKSLTEVLSTLRRRLENKPETERAVVREELTKIVRSRLAKLAVPSVSTHILDTSRGRPAPGVPVRLEARTGTGWELVSEETTGTDGRATGWLTRPGTHRLVFDLGAYHGESAFYPEVVVVFRIADSSEHYHVPLLISQFGYSTYRGS